MSKEEGNHQSLFSMPGLVPDLHNTFNQILETANKSGKTVEESIKLATSVTSFHALEYITNDQMQNKEHVSGKSIAAQQLAHNNDGNDRGGGHSV